MPVFTASKFSTVHALKFLTIYSTLFWPKFCFFVQLFLKILSGKANRADPDQTAPSGAVWSGPALFAYTTLSATLVYEILGHLCTFIFFVATLTEWLQTNEPRQGLLVLIVLGFNDTSTLEGHFVSSPREREKRDRRESRGDEREGQGRKRNRNESEETEEIKTFPLYPYPLQG